MKNNYRVKRWSEIFLPDSAKLNQIMQAEGFSVFEWMVQMPFTEITNTLRISRIG